MSTSIHIPKGLNSFHISNDSQQTSKHKPVSILLKRVVADLQKWLNSTWAAGMIPGGSELVPELNLLCVAGDDHGRQAPDLICPIHGDTSSRLAAVIALGPRRDGTAYSEEDHRFADAVCKHLSGLLANEQLAHKISNELTCEEAQKEDENARAIYERLDHCRAQQIRGLEYGGQCHRARKSGGDFFDLQPRGERDLMLAIGHITARGLPAGIMLGGALASLRALVKRGESLAQMVMELNRTLCELSPEDSFTPFLYAQVDPSSRCLRYVNAGHEPGLLIHGRNGQVDRLESTGAVLGLSVRGAYRERMLPFEPGDLLAVFTDGIAESAGPDRVIRILREGLRSGVQELAAHVLDSAEAAVDRTIVLVRAKEAESVPLPMQHYEMVAA